MYPPIRMGLGFTFTFFEFLRVLITTTSSTRTHTHTHHVDAHTYKVTCKRSLVMISFSLYHFASVRPIEDHECVYDVIQNWAPGSFNALKLVEDYSKFELFSEPAVRNTILLFLILLPWVVPMIISSDCYNTYKRDYLEVYGLSDDDLCGKVDII